MRRAACLHLRGLAPEQIQWCSLHISTSPCCRDITLGGDPSMEQPILWEIEGADLLQVGYAGLLTFQASLVLQPISHMCWVPARQLS